MLSKVAYVGRWPSLGPFGEALDRERARKAGREFPHRCLHLLGVTV